MRYDTIHFWRKTLIWEFPKRNTLAKLSYTPIIISSMISVTHLSPRGGSYYERPETVGFEPTDAGIKTLCLTAWRRPKKTRHNIKHFYFLNKSLTIKLLYMPL